MDDAREARILALLREALDVESDARDAYLRDACAGDSTLYERVSALLTDAEADAEDLDAPLGRGDVRAPLGLPGDPPSVVVERLRKHLPDESRYEQGGEVARGGMGTILEALDVDLRRKVAMKVLRDPTGEGPIPLTPAASTRRIARFVEEAQITGQLDHPGILPVHELGLDPTGRLFFTMRLVRGREFGAIIKDVHRRGSEWTVTRALGVLLRVCEAMAFAHSKSVIHRDLKPANIMVGRFGETYVMDWGLAKVMGREDTKDIRLKAHPSSTMSVVVSEVRGDDDDHGDSHLMTMDGDVLGTPCYMPPEQAGGRVHEMGPESDVYSLGCILYQILAGHPPYLPPGSRLTPNELLTLIASRPPTPLQETGARAPAELVAICEKAMARMPGERYGDTLEMAEDLRAYMEGRVVTAHETGALAELRKWVLRNRGTSLAAGVAIVAVVAGLVTAVHLESSAKDVIDLNADFHRMHYLVSQADLLWPAHPEREAELEAWLAAAGALVERRARHEARLDELRAAGTTGASATGRGPEPLDAVRERELLDGIDDLQGGSGERGLIDDMEERLAFARSVGEHTVAGEEPARAWAEAIGSIADPERCPAYDGLVIAPQLGLVPLGRNEDTGLWEFWHPQTGTRPVRDRFGVLAITEDTGLVFVLLPGGPFTMGAQPPSPELGADAPNVDDEATDLEGPVHEVVLAPFFLSKYEMTQRQWLAIAGDNPAFYKPGNAFGDGHFTLRHPVERLTWEMARRAMHNLGLRLPTEAQWEYGARGGTTSKWSTGDDLTSLQDHANLGDATCARNGPKNWTYQTEIDDGHTTSAPVGSFEPNPFGLHDVHGNVWEWCEDVLGSYRYAVREGDGLRDVQEDLWGLHVFRGGAYYHTAGALRSAYRFPAPGFPHSYGVRPARPLAP